MAISLNILMKQREVFRIRLQKIHAAKWNKVWHLKYNPLSEYIHIHQ